MFCYLICPLLTLTFLLIPGWLKRDDVILLGTSSSRKLRVKSVSVSDSSLTPVETEYCFVNLVEKSSTSGFYSSMFTCFHR